MTPQPLHITWRWITGFTVFLRVKSINAPQFGQAGLDFILLPPTSWHLELQVGSRNGSFSRRATRQEDIQQIHQRPAKDVKERISERFPLPFWGMVVGFVLFFLLAEIAPFISPLFRIAVDFSAVASLLGSAICAIALMVLLLRKKKRKPKRRLLRAGAGLSSQFGRRLGAD